MRQKKCLVIWQKIKEKTTGLHLTKGYSPGNGILVLVL